MGCDWKPGDPSFYNAYTWFEDEQKWYVGWNPGDPYWEGPYDKVVDKMIEVQRNYMRLNKFHRAKIVKHNQTWRLTLL